MRASRKIVAASAVAAGTLMLASVAVAMSGPTQAPRPEISAEPSVLRISDVRPGQERHATMTLTNTAPVDAELSAVVSASGHVVEAGEGLRLSVLACEEPWQGQDCFADEPALVLGEAVSGTVSARTDYELGSGKTSHLLVGVSLDEGVGNAAQGLSGELSLTWVGTEPVNSAPEPEPTDTPELPVEDPTQEPTPEPEPTPTDEPTEAPDPEPTPIEEPTQESDPIVIDPPAYVAPSPSPGDHGGGDAGAEDGPGADGEVSDLSDEDGEAGDSGGSGEDSETPTGDSEDRGEGGPGPSSGSSDDANQGAGQLIERLAQTGVPSIAALGLLASAAAGLGAMLLTRRGRKDT